MTFDLHAAVARLAGRSFKDSDTSRLALKAAVLQFNSYLEAAKARYPESIDIQSLDEWPNPGGTWADLLRDSIGRLADALGAVADDLPSGQPRMASKLGILRADPQLEADFSAHATDLRALGLLFLDIDHFKALNTEFTETVVDELILAPFQRFLLDLVHLRGFAYLVGGDEFVVLLRNVDGAETLAFGERLLRATRARSFPIGPKEVSLTLSVGAAAFPQDGETLASLRRQANAAENAAKAAGRNRVLSAASLNDGAVR